MICIHEVIYSVCSRNFCGILSASEDFKTHDEMMSLLANTLADAAGHAGCLPILDCFSPHPGEEVTVSIPMCDDTVDIVLEDLGFRTSGKNCWRTAAQILWATLLITCAIVRKTIFLLPFPLKMRKSCMQR